MGGDDISRDKNNPWQSSSRPHQEEADDIKLWGVFLFGLIGATATTFAVSSISLLCFCLFCLPCLRIFVVYFIVEFLNLICN